MIYKTRPFSLYGTRKRETTRREEETRARKSFQRQTLENKLWVVIASQGSRELTLQRDTRKPYAAAGRVVLGLFTLCLTRKSFLVHPSICKQEFRAVVSKECLSVRVCWLVSNGKSRGQILLVREDGREVRTGHRFPGGRGLGGKPRFCKVKIWYGVAWPSYFQATQASPSSAAL